MAFINLGSGNHCKWSTDPSEQLIYIIYEKNCLNILDINKGDFLLKDRVKLKKKFYRNFYIRIILKSGQRF